MRNKTINYLNIYEIAFNLKKKKKICKYDCTFYIGTISLKQTNKKTTFQLKIDNNNV